MKRSLNHHSLAAMSALLASSALSAAAEGSPLSLGNAENMLQNGADLDPSKRPPLFDLATANCINADGQGLGQAHGITKMRGEETHDGPLSNAKIFAAGNKDVMAAGTLVAQTLAKMTRTPAVAFV